jgi:single-strand DNA-binding protein
MAGVNKVILLGRLGRDPEARNMPAGGKVVSFSVATSETWNDKASGERKERTQWHRVVIFNEALGGIAERFLKKGSEVYLEGAMETRKFTDKDGAERETTEVVLRQYRGELTLVGGRNSGESEAGGSGGGGYAPRERAAAPARSAPAQRGGGGAPSWESPANHGDLDDDIPF